MAEHPLPLTGEIVLYHTEGGRTRAECPSAEDTLWLSLALMAELPQKGVRTISEHLKSTYSGGGPAAEATIRESRTTAVKVLGASLARSRTTVSRRAWRRATGCASSETRSSVAGVPPGGQPICAKASAAVVRRPDGPRRLRRRTAAAVSPERRKPRSAYASGMRVG